MSQKTIPKSRYSKPVANFLRDVGFKAATSAEEFFRKLSRVAGEQKANEFGQWLEQLDDVTADGQDLGDYYRFKNETFALSMAISSLYDSPFVGAVCELICRMKHCLGGDMLDVGCESGAVTCFVARLFPGSHIVGIDRCPEAIEVARKLAARLNLTNVDFRVADLADDLPQTFDTVICSRLLRETSVSTFEDADYRLRLVEQANITCADYRELADRLARLLNEDGTLLFCDALASLGDALGFALALTQSGLQTEAVVRHGVAEFGVALTALAARPSPRIDTGEIYSTVCEAFITHLEKQGSQNETAASDRAAIFLEELAGELVVGYNFYDNGLLDSRCAIWKPATPPEGAGAPDKNHILQFFHAPVHGVAMTGEDIDAGQHIVVARTADEMAGDMADIETLVAEARASGETVRAIRYVDGREEELPG